MEEKRSYKKSAEANLQSLKIVNFQTPKSKKGTTEVEVISSRYAKLNSRNDVTVPNGKIFDTLKKKPLPAVFLLKD
jgi:hypothetical protein